MVTVSQLNSIFRMSSSPGTTLAGSSINTRVPLSIHIPGLALIPARQGPSPHHTFDHYLSSSASEKWCNTLVLYEFQEIVNLPLI